MIMNLNFIILFLKKYMYMLNYLLLHYIALGA